MGSGHGLYSRVESGSGSFSRVESGKSEPGAETTDEPVSDTEDEDGHGVSGPGHHEVLERGHLVPALRVLPTQPTLRTRNQILTPRFVYSSRNISSRHSPENDVWWFMDSYTHSSFSGE